ncbi:MAG: hypothetical protein MJK10_05280 [Pseudomonadales bacterium]|nr:hypothetical protein [Pseudomonadales bacterium]
MSAILVLTSRFCTRLSAAFFYSNHRLSRKLPLQQKVGKNESIKLCIVGRVQQNIPFCGYFDTSVIALASLDREGSKS